VLKNRLSTSRTRPGAIDEGTGCVAPHGHVQIAPSVRDLVDELLMCKPLATLRAVATLAGVSRDTAHRRQQVLIARGWLPRRSRKALATARNRARWDEWFATHPDVPRPRPQRGHLHDWTISVTVGCTLPDGKEVSWSEGPRVFARARPVSDEAAKMLMERWASSVNQAAFEVAAAHRTQRSVSRPRWRSAHDL
jgi:hypothetical protein